MIPNSLNYLGLNNKQLFIDLSILLFLLFVGYMLSDAIMLEHDKDITPEKLSVVDIFINNIKVAFFSIIGTIIFGYLIFFLNGLFLGMILQNASNVYSFETLLGLFVFHGPVEMLCWLLTLQISMQLTKRIFNKSARFPSKTLVILTILLYFIAALIETTVSRSV